MLLREETPNYKIHLSGTSALADVELLALLIAGESSYSMKKARTVLTAIGSLKELGKCTFQELETLTLTQKESARVVAALEVGRRRELYPIENRLRIGNSRDAFNAIAPMLVDLTHEEFWILTLNRANEVTHRCRMSSGGQTGTVVDIKMIIKKAIDLKAAAIIAVHNHPSGNLQPSAAGVELTAKLKSACKILEMPLLDHIIVSERGYHSFSDEGMI